MAVGREPGRSLARASPVLAGASLLLAVACGGSPGVLTTAGAPPSAPRAESPRAPGDFWSGAAPISLTLEADFRRLRTEDRVDRAPYRDATLVLDSSGVRVPAQIRTRGNFRLRPSVCAFPPLRVRVDEDRATEGGIPEELLGLGSARLVSPCRGTNADLVMLEYLAYRLYRIVSDRAFAVRPVHATFVDASGRDGVRRSEAFVVESDSHLGRRLGLTFVPDSPSVITDPRSVDPESLGTLEVFQYMIGNTDWSIETRHNVVVGRDDVRTLAIPYDFDFAGLVDAPYAAPDPRLGIQSVTTRIFRGLCRPDDTYRRIVGRFAAHRGGMLSEVDATVALSSFARGRARRYLTEFFREVDTGRALRSFRATCRGG